MAEYRFLRENTEDSYGLKLLQDTLTEIVLYIDSFCKEHNIRYFLMGGSALGAVRHGGFIPWDDDLDIFMLREDYEKFVECCKTDLDTGKYYFQQADSAEQPHFFSKIRKNGTAYLEEGRKGENIHQGIYIDIMCLYYAPQSRWKRKLQYYAAGLLKARACTKTNYHTASRVKKLELTVAKVVVHGPIKKLLLHMVKKYKKEGSPLAAHLFGRAKFDCSFYPVEEFEKQRYVPFEKIQLPIPGNAEEYLTIRYGKDYMQMPDQATRAIYGTHSVMWDTQKDYKELIK